MLSINTIMVHNNSSYALGTSPDTSEINKNV